MLISENSKKIIDSCLFCWMCRHICPIGNATGQERNNARARALSLQYVERGAAELSECIDNVYECATCGGCENFCVTGWQPIMFVNEARKIAAMPMPVISAVGHETDFTICDFVADLRAPTPSAAAELAVPDVRVLILSLVGAAERASGALLQLVKRKGERLSSLEDRLRLLGSGRLFEGKRQTLSHLAEKLQSALKINLERKGNEIALRAEKLEALSPLRVLGRGYCVAESNGSVVSSVESAAIGAPLSITLSDGKISAVVQDKEKFSNE